MVNIALILYSTISISYLLLNCLYNRFASLEFLQNLRKKTALAKKHGVQGGIGAAGIGASPTTLVVRRGGSLRIPVASCMQMLSHSASLVMRVQSFSIDKLTFISYIDVYLCMCFVYNKSYVIYKFINL